MKIQSIQLLNFTKNPICYAKNVKYELKEDKNFVSPPADSKYYQARLGISFGKNEYTEITEDIFTNIIQKMIQASLPGLDVSLIQIPEVYDDKGNYNSDLGEIFLNIVNRAIKQNSNKKTGIDAIEFAQEMFSVIKEPNGDYNFDDLGDIYNFFDKNYNSDDTEWTCKEILNLSKNDATRKINFDVANTLQKLRPYRKKDESLKNVHTTLAFCCLTDDSMLAPEETYYFTKFFEKACSLKDVLRYISFTLTQDGLNNEVADAVLEILDYLTGDDCISDEKNSVLPVSKEDKIFIIESYLLLKSCDEKGNFSHSLFKKEFEDLKIACDDNLDYMTFIAAQDLTEDKFE